MGGGFWAWSFFNSQYLDFEEGYTDNQTIPELVIDGYTFMDRNGNGSLDVYEDDRNPMQDRVEDLVDQMSIEEKIHLLKGSGLRSAMGRMEAGEGIPGAVGTIVPTPRLGLPTFTYRMGRRG